MIFKYAQTRTMSISRLLTLNLGTYKAVTTGNPGGNITVMLKMSASVLQVTNDWMPQSGALQVCNMSVMLLSFFIKF